MLTKNKQEIHQLNWNVVRISLNHLGMFLGVAKQRLIIGSFFMF